MHVVIYLITLVLGLLVAFLVGFALRYVQKPTMQQVTYTQAQSTPITTKPAVQRILQPTKVITVQKSTASEILPGKLYLGNRHDARQVGKTNIRYIINMTTLPEGVLDVMKSNLNFHYLDCPLADLRTSDISRYFDKTYDFIENANTPVLVHCYAGISRSATIVLAYLMRKNQWTLEQAFRYVRERRPIIYPNIGFLNALKMYEIEIMTK